MGLHMHRKLIAIITAVFMLMSVQAPAVFAADETADPSAVETQQEQISKDAKAPSEEAKPDEETQQQAAVKEEKSEAAEEEQTAPKQEEATQPAQPFEQESETKPVADKQDKTDGNDDTDKEKKSIHVYFELLGDQKHETEEVHLLLNDDLEKWIKDAQVEIDKDSTVKDLFKAVMDEQNYEYRFADNGELISVTRAPGEGGLCLAKGDNGEDSAWLFTINDRHPQQAMEQIKLQEGDRITVHFSDNVNEELAPEYGTAETSEEAVEEAAEEQAAGETGEEAIEEIIEETTDEDADRCDAVEVNLVKASAKEVGDAYGNTKDKMIALAETANWSFDSNWIVLASARGGELTQAQAQKYYNDILATLEKNGSATINKNQSSDNAKTILALTAAGYDVTDVNGYNLLEPLANSAFVRAQGINGPVWALLAFDSKNYEIPQLDTSENPNLAKLQTTRDGLITMLINGQKSDGGWAFSGKSSDVDMTCMVLQALAPYYKNDHKVTVNGKEKSVKDVVDTALAWLSSQQHKDGSFSSINVVTSESASQVIVALTSLGIDPTKDKRFVKNGKNAVDSLLSFYVQGGGFKHVDSNYKYNGLASMQGYYALVSYYRFKDGKNPLYDMTDADEAYKIDVDYSEEEEQKPDPGKDDKDKKDKDKGGKEKDKNKQDQAAGETKAAGTTKSLTKSAGLIKLNGKMTKEAKASISLIEAVVKRDLPKNAAKYSKEDIKAIEDAYKEYMKLTPAEQLAVEKDKNWKPYCAITAKLGKLYHKDKKSGIDLTKNQETVLPWYIKLVVEPKDIEAEQADKIAGILGEGGQLFSLYDIHFINSLDGKEWTPKQIVTVRIPIPEELSDNPLAVHITDKGKVEFIKGETVEKTVAGEEVQLLEFAAADFSPYGIAGMKGSISDLMETQEKEEKGLLPWICIGAGAVLALAGLVIARRKLTADEE